jgi:protein-S-isoprenylcysteine O-methyltransferase Ste14
MRDGMAQRGGYWVLLQGLLMSVVLTLSVVFPDGGRDLARTVLGAGLLAAGAVLGLAGAVALRRNLTPFPRPAENAQLVTRGVYRCMRHPLYVSVTLGAIGWAMLWHSWPALIPAVLLVPFFDAKARREEQWLREKFPEYRDYARQVRRFIPGIY